MNTFKGDQVVVERPKSSTTNDNVLRISTLGISVSFFLQKNLCGNYLLIM